MDALKLLRDDHATVKGLFKKFEQAGDRAYKTKRRLVDQMIENLSVHATIEEQLFYPGVREMVQSSEDLVLEALEEHHVVKWILSELEGMDPRHERFDAKVMVMIESVRHHIEEEEGEMFPKVRKALKPAQLRELGERMEQAKTIAPKRPHPRSPDEPPANLITGPVSAAMDAGKRAVGRVVRRGRT